MRRLAGVADREDHRVHADDGELIWLARVRREVPLLAVIT